MRKFITNTNRLLPDKSPIHTHIHCTYTREQSKEKEREKCDRAFIHKGLKEDE